ncbi:MAG TPA: integrase arm-type DNA-binding domain-containing protein, partial [Burkholderiaceae bacterium]|nr:integrase arm-type DNA-binding domain-containing protein [Burkholderiaceae bacterium]
MNRQGMARKTYTASKRTGTTKIDKLTPDKIMAMVPGEEIADPHAPGLRVRCGKQAPDGKARRVFFYRYRDKAGALRQIKLGDFGPLTLAMARRARDKKRVELDQGIDPVVQKKQERAEAKLQRDAAKAEKARQQNTVNYLVECYLTDVVEPSRKPKGAAETRRMLGRAITKVQDLPADEITRERAHEIVKAVAKTAPRVAQMTRQELRACWEHALTVGRVKNGNPFLGRTIGAIPKIAPKQTALKPAQVGTLLRWMREPNTYSRTVADALELTLRTGLRTGEVCGLNTEEIEEREGVLWADIPAARMKEGRPHSVAFVGRAREIVVARLQQSSGFLFPARRGAGPIG